MSDNQQLPATSGGAPFRAIVVKHNDRGGRNLCIGAEGYNPESYVVLGCTEEERERFPIGTQFDLVCVEETRGTACQDCLGAGGKWSLSALGFVRCAACNGNGRKS